MARSETTRLLRIAMTLVLALPLSSCTGGPGGPTASPTAFTGPTPTPAGAADAFSSLPYRLDLPAGWVTLGSPGYDMRLDATPEMRTWLAGLGLEGQNEFRAYEPLDGGAGLRLAVNPQRTWNPSPLQDEGSVAALPGVTGTVSSDVVATGGNWKAFGYRWSESMDWGSGTPSARDCVGYFVMTGPNPVNAVFCWPAGTQREAAAEAIVGTFAMTGTPVFSLPPGETPTPSPTPFDKFASPEPIAASHGVPDLEALLPDVIAGRKLAKESWTGVESPLPPDSPVLVALGKTPADRASAQGIADSDGTRPVLVVAVERIAGVSGERLLAANLAAMPDAKLSTVTLGGHRVTLVEYGMMPYWVYATGDVVYSIGITDDATAAAFFAALP